MRPKRTDDKHWKGTRDFDHIQYEIDLEDYIIDLENENNQLHKQDVSRRSEQCLHTERVWTIDPYDQKCFKCVKCGEYGV